MIVDKIENLKDYACLNPLFADVVDYISRTDLSAQLAGKHVIKGEDLFANFNFCKGKRPEEAALETHNAMIDIQMPLNHAETIGYTPRAELAETDYDEANDISFYPCAAQQYVTLQPGMFAIFFPQDAHAPAICEYDDLRKIIFKVALARG